MSSLKALKLKMRGGRVENLQLEAIWREGNVS